MAGKVGCGLLLAVLFAVAAVSRAPFAVFLLAWAVLVVVFLAWYARTLRRDVTATLQLPARPVRPGEEFAVLAQLHNAGRRPVPELRVVLQTVDAESGTAIELPCGAMLAPGQRADLRVTLRAAKSGLWRFRVREITVRDPLGLFAVPCAVPPQSRELCVLPPAEGEDDGAGTKPQNKVEKVTAAGRDMADGVYDLRPYRAGDSLKQIHWKLTARVGELTVREPLGATYCADPAGAIMAEGADAPQQVLHFAQTAVKRLRTMTRRRTADPDTGLVFIDRVLLPRTGAAARPVLETAVDLLILELLALGLLTALNGAFALALPVWVWLGTAALCPVWLALHRAPLPNAARRGVTLALAVGYLVLLFVLQRTFLAGAQQCADAVRLCLNTRFDANFAVVTSPIPAQSGLFVLLAAIPVTAFLAAVTAWHADALLLGLALLPVMVFTLLAGTGSAVLGWLLLLPGWLGACAAARSVQRKRLWGGKDSAAYAANLQTHRTNQKLAASGMAVACTVLFLPALALRPVLTLPLNALQPVTDKAQAAVLSVAIEWLPKISDGALNFHLSAAAGGVEDGSLTQGDGLALTGLEDLMVTASAMPEETVYLRGFIGADYDGTSWQSGDAAAFDSAASNWKTDGNGRLAIANLPFLRAAYSGTEPRQMTVQRLHVNDAYTFAPYNAYFNDYYTPDGDGAIAGQTTQDDTFYYFPRKQAKELLAARADGDASVLDRLESAYAAYAEARYLALPAGAEYDAIREELDALAKERKLKDNDTDGRRTLVRSWLNERCHYSADAAAPDGADPVLYFLNESHGGSSTQFASAAVVLCRMLGLPARYVVGYAAPQSLFTAQGDGSYRAVLQDDNAHAWAEVYLAGQGWTPLEVTPGMAAELTEGELPADTPLAGENVANEDDAPLPTQNETQTPDSTSRNTALLWVLPVILLLAVLVIVEVRRVRRAPLQIVQAEFRALYRKMRRCGLGENVSSDEAAFAEFLQAHCPQTDGETIQSLLAAVQMAQFAPGPCTQETAQGVRTICRKLRRKMRKGVA